MWTDPPHFVEDGRPLSAIGLNALSDNAAWLYNQVRRMVPAMPVYHAPWHFDFQYVEQVQAEYRIRHVGRYLRVRTYSTTEIPVSGGDDLPGFTLHYDGQLILDENWPANGTTKWVGDFTVDLQAELPGLVVGTRYQIVVEQKLNDFGQATGFFELVCVYETEMVEP